MRLRLRRDCRRPQERLGVPPERCESPWAAEAPGPAFNVLVEPHEAIQPIGANTSEQVVELRRLACGDIRAGLGDENRITGQRTYSNDSRPEHLSEARGRKVIVAINSYPGHIGLTGPPGSRVGNVDRIVIIDDVNCP